MEFWGVEVKPGETLTCNPGDDKYLHLSQAALGEIQNAKENERFPIYVHTDDKKIMIGTLAYGKCDQIWLDIVFEKEFKLSHSCTSASVFFCGYTTVTQDGDEFGGFDDEDSESEDDKQAQAMRSPAKVNGKAEAKPTRPEVATVGTKPVKPESETAGKAATKVKPELKLVAGKNVGKYDDESGDDDEDEDEDDEDDDEEMAEDSSDDEDESGESEDDSEDESDEDDSKKTPKVEVASKKRPLPDSAIKSPATDKKAKVITPAEVQKPGIDVGKKGGPKIPGGTPTTAAKQQVKAKGTQGAKEAPKPTTTPGSGKKLGEHFCSPCSRNFATESALNQHNTAKHGGK
eukprot:Gb_28752 [translate_table: standard]